MRSDHVAPAAIDLLSPVSAGTDADVADAAVLAALVTVEVALVRGWAMVGATSADVAETVSRTFDWSGPAKGCGAHGLDAAALALGTEADGTPVRALTHAMSARLPADAALWVHRGATSQDILDTALMRVARHATGTILRRLEDTAETLAVQAELHRDQPGAARTLTQHAVPTTVGLRFATWLRGVRRAIEALRRIRAELPAQLGGAAGTLASFTEIARLSGADGAALPAAFARETGLAVPDAPWHTVRWPVSELGDALVQVVDAVGVLAADVATLSRTEIAEVTHDASGGSSAMPQKRNPVDAVLIRSASLRAPYLGAALHSAAAAAVDERPDGAWHAEWPTLRELLRLALGTSARAAALVEGLRIDAAAVARNLAATRGLLVTERLAVLLGPRIGADRLAEVVAGVRAGGDLGARLAALPETAGLDIEDLVAPGRYLGLASELVDTAVADHRGRRDTEHPG